MTFKGLVQGFLGFIELIGFLIDLLCKGYKRPVGQGVIFKIKIKNS